MMKAVEHVVASMIPLVRDTAESVLPGGWDIKPFPQHSTLMPVWWSLALGACLGGNGSPVGASANVITIGLSEKAGYPISFKKYIVYAIPITVETIILSTIYIWLRYYILH
jgi:Na+/H+ antiporter NhaD/arsenite permease-like protein